MLSSLCNITGNDGADRKNITRITANLKHQNIEFRPNT